MIWGCLHILVLHSLFLTELQYLIGWWHMSLHVSQEQLLPWTLMLLVANFANTEWCKKAEKWLKPWQIGTHLTVLSESFPMNTNMTGLRWLSSFCAFFVLWIKVVSALERLSAVTCHQGTCNSVTISERVHYYKMYTWPMFWIGRKSDENWNPVLPVCSVSSAWTKGYLSIINILPTGNEFSKIKHGPTTTCVRGRGG